jgi:hypothetical protein
MTHSSLLVAAILLNAASMVYSCSCTAEGPPACPPGDAILHVAVISQVAECQGSGQRLYSAEIIDVVSGYTLSPLETGDVITMETSLDSAACGENFELGKEYLLVSSMVEDKLRTVSASDPAVCKDSGDFSTGLCSGNIAYPTPADIDAIRTACAAVSPKAGPDGEDALAPEGVSTGVTGVYLRHLLRTLLNPLPYLMSRWRCSLWQSKKVRLPASTTSAGTEGEGTGTEGEGTGTEGEGTHSGNCTEGEGEGSNSGEGSETGVVIGTSLAWHALPRACMVAAALCTMCMALVQ